MSKETKATKKKVSKAHKTVKNKRKVINSAKPPEEYKTEWYEPVEIKSDAGLVHHKKKYKDIFSKTGIHQVYTIASNGGNLTLIADMFGMSWDTLKRYRNQYPEIDDAYKRGRAETVNNLFLRATQLALKDKQGPAVFKWIEMFGKRALKELDEIEASESKNNTNGLGTGNLTKQDLQDALNKDKFIDVEPVIEAESEPAREKVINGNPKPKTDKGSEGTE